MRLQCGFSRLKNAPISAETASLKWGMAPRYRQPMLPGGPWKMFAPPSKNAFCRKLVGKSIIVAAKKLFKVLSDRGVPPDISLLFSVICHIKDASVFKLGWLTMMPTYFTIPNSIQSPFEDLFSCQKRTSQSSSYLNYQTSLTLI